MIEASVQKRQGTFLLSAELGDDGLICLAGRNGSGKTTLLRVLAGLLPIDVGYVRVDGTDITKLPPERRGVVMVTPGSCLPHFEVDAHLTWGARLRGVRVDPSRLSKLKSELGIDFGGTVGRLSLGMRERVSLATALLASPRVILVDEAFSNLHERDGFISAYGNLASAGGIQVLSSTQARTDARFFEHLYVMDEGRLTRSF